MGRLARFVLLGMPLTVAGYWLLLFVTQRSILFPRALGAASGHPAGVEQVWLATSAGRVEAWFLPPAVRSDTPAPLLLFAHGNGELIDHWAAAFDAPRAAGFAVLLVEYPGYGRSEGSPSEASINAVMLAAYDHARARPDVDSTRIVAHGRSLGGGAVCLLATERPLAALILESTFTSVRAFAWHFGAPGILVRDPFDNLAALTRYQGPLLVLHGERDEIIPVAHGLALARAHTRAEFHGLLCGHNDCTEGWPIIRGFLSKHTAWPETR